MDPAKRPPRKRLKRAETLGGPRFLTFSCHRRLPLFRNPAIADHFACMLDSARIRFRFQLIAWVVMPEHIHLILIPHPDHPAKDALQWLKREFAKSVLGKWKRTNAPILTRIAVKGGYRFWQAGGGFDRNVRDEAELSREIRYIHRNPVERGLCPQPADWKWSSIRWWMGHRRDELHCDWPPGNRLMWMAWQGYE